MLAPAKARECNEQERGGGWGAIVYDRDVEGGSEGIGRPQ